MKLHPCKVDTGTKLWCGPSVVASLTGRKLSRVHDVIRRHRGDVRWDGKRAVKGISSWTLVKTLRYYGFEVRYPQEITPKEKRITVAAWLRQPREKHKAYVLVVGPGTGDHFITVCRRKAMNTLNGREPVFIGELKQRRARVVHVMEVFRKD